MWKSSDSTLFYAPDTFDRSSLTYCTASADSGIAVNNAALTAITASTAATIDELNELKSAVDILKMRLDTLETKGTNRMSQLRKELLTLREVR